MTKINRLPKQTNRLENVTKRKEKLEYTFQGYGLYVFRNNTKGTLELPKPTAKGIKYIPAGGEWEGDDYYMKLVPKEARFVREIMSPAQEKEAKLLQERTKLILDQPDKVTNQGKVEQVVVNDEITLPSKKPMRKNESKKEQKEQLINEDPMDGVHIING